MSSTSPEVLSYLFITPSHPNTGDNNIDSVAGLHMSSTISVSWILLWPFDSMQYRVAGKQVADVQASGEIILFSSLKGFKRNSSFSLKIFD